MLAAHRVDQLLQMARPRPVPPKRRVVEESAWENGSNSRRAVSGAMPMPVSLTSNRTQRRRRSVALLELGADDDLAARR